MFVTSCPFGGGLLIHFTRSGGGGGPVCSDFAIDPFDFDPSNRKLELQLTSFGDRFRDKRTQKLAKIEPQQKNHQRTRNLAPTSCLTPSLYLAAGGTTVHCGLA